MNLMTGVETDCHRAPQSTPASNSDILRLSPFAMDLMLWIVRFRSPRSTWPIYVQCIPLAAAKSSCDHSRSFRNWRIRAPRVAWMFFATSEVSRIDTYRH